ncbi:MAG: hypothetical protein GC179_19585 [Anaerolineaceae bacterium]|nr:hypothetical protein [Anaerolineaceae bacterium]
MPFDETVSGQLRGKGEKVTYTFDMPIDQDIVFEYRANKLVFTTYCIFTGETQPDADHCSAYGGSGGDRPVNGFDIIPTTGQEGQHATITLIGVLDGASTYQITAHTITPQLIKLGKDVDGMPSGSQPFQTYTLETDPQIPFTVEIEDEAADGNFLWAAYQPFAYEAARISPQKLLPLPMLVDWANGSNGAGINQLEVLYLGGNTFRILAQASMRYKLHTSSINLPTLNENATLNLSVSYRKPLLVTRLNIQPSETAQVTFTVTNGKGAIGRVYEEGNLVDEGLTLGRSDIAGSNLRLSGSIQRTTVKALYVVVHIPFDFTRDQVNVEVKWHRVN